MARSIWKGAISFGLVHIPVALVSATAADNVDFDWLDERTMDPVGYKRINKKSGKEVTKENIVKGIQYEKGKYVVLSEEEIRAAHPKSTQTIDIFSFVDAADIPLVNIDTPYYLAPDKRGEKVYALLREALSGTGKVGLANVVIHTKQHLAALMVVNEAMVLVLLRWPKEVKDQAILELSKTTTNVTLNRSEKEMAIRLINDMSGNWSPEDYRDTFQEKIMALVDKKVAQGKIENVETEASDTSTKTADIIDLTELLKRSLGGGKPKAESNVKSSSKSETSRRAAPKKSGSTSEPKAITKTPTKTTAKTPTKTTATTSPKTSAKTATRTARKKTGA